MDIEQKQAEHIEYFVKQASTHKGASVSNVVVEATSHPSLFAFSEILAVPNVLENGINGLKRPTGGAHELGKSEITENQTLQGTENSVYLDLLRLFAHGTWSDYKMFSATVSSGASPRRYVVKVEAQKGCNAGRLPQLVPDQTLKLKQLTVLTLAETEKVLPYDILMQELDVTNVRELEDFLINECMYVGIVRGKLDQLRRCFEVQFAAGRDLRPGQLGSMIQTLTNWLTTSDNLLITIQEKIKWADSMSEVDKKHRKEVEERVDEVKKSISLKEVKHCEQADIDFRGHEEIYSEPGGVMDYEEDRSRPKRRRHPMA
ncbi:unnamed protein product [Camellia sinensis]